MPRSCAAAAARTSDSKSPCVVGISTGTAAVPAATSRVASVRLSRKLAPASAARRNSAGSPESTLTLHPLGLDSARSRLRDAEMADLACSRGRSRPRPARAVHAHARPAPQSPGAAHRRFRQRCGCLGATDRVDAPARPKIGRQIDQFLGTASERYRRIPGLSRSRIDAGATRQDHPIGRTGRADGAAMIGSVMSAATCTPISTTSHSKPGLAHRRRARAAAAARRRWPVRNRMRSVMPQQRRRSAIADSSSASDQHHVRASKPESRCVFSRSIRRGYTFTMPPGALVSSSGAVSQANTIEGTRHLPAWANTLVASCPRCRDAFGDRIRGSRRQYQRVIDAS